MSNERIGEEDIRKAVNWWAQFAKDPKPHSNGDGELHSILAGALYDTQSEPADPKAVGLFRDELGWRLRELADSGKPVIFLDCDYAPCELLADSARDAGVRPENFPWKTSMHIEPGKVVVKYGYGAGWAVI